MPPVAKLFVTVLLTILAVAAPGAERRRPAALPAQSTQLELLPAILPLISLPEMSTLPLTKMPPPKLCNPDVSESAPLPPTRVLRITRSPCTYAPPPKHEAARQELENRLLSTSVRLPPANTPAPTPVE